MRQKKGKGKVTIEAVELLGSWLSMLG